ncbi:hypothetical protein ACOT7R_08750 [Clostridium perfringens]|uniref:hypothetical protein n=1 Tax=Clostridium perfringens TaxID=1502 RepID=UPI003BAB29C0
MDYNRVTMSNSIKDWETTMTLFYGLKTGIIRGFSSGRQDLGYYGKDIDDFNYGFIVVDKDEYVINNLEKFIIKNGELMMKVEPSLNKYKIAEV